MKYQKNLIGLLLFSVVGTYFHAQSVSMNFPKFAGKTYDFILFQGKDSRVQKGTIPQDGKFILEVPKELSPYTGMSRWLITGTQEGGGLDMIIPGHDFSVECLAAMPDNKNIIYKNNTENSLLETEYQHQKKIVDQFTAMSMATKAYSADHKNYSLYQKEVNSQKASYVSLQKDLQKKNNYASKFLKIVTVSMGMGGTLEDNEEMNKQELLRTIAEDIQWEAAFTSGHWDGMIAMFTELEKKDDGGTVFTADFKRIGDQLSDPKLYMAFAERVTYYLTQSGHDDIITKLSPVILGSGKIKSYAGMLAVYQKGTVGGKAPELVLSLQKDSNLPSGKVDFADPNYRKTLLVFYRSDCGHCDVLMQELASRQDEIKNSAVRLIALSADTDRKTFDDELGKLGWKSAASCDLKGMKGSNFMNYGVQATPTLFVIDQTGNIVSRESSVEPALKALSDPSKELWRKIRRPPRPAVPVQLQKQ
ncbi:redoxin family protein [Chryseobacterium rhizoplanae]|uniref:TlpA family protein disulfide reductase n=1 Tax=Chryseobacterium rhizoplanae TaxID=1609531 RepID=UPI001CE2E9A5|nr:thioredoxin-like domain-containing protein [Chryseobacterium rhizoplanae]UCA61809.1 redoxin family protein [Chryseobacterium rhizoplanae]